jgi:HD-GYP domain-containing protein (c-di-GMP phosphodiesterase class II)
MGDEVAMRGALYGVDWGSPLDVLSTIAGFVGRGEAPLERVVSIARALSKMPRLTSAAVAHCEVGDQLAHRVGFGEEFRRALAHTFERWDGTGWPHALVGERIAPAMRLAQLGEDVEIGHRFGGTDGARALVKKRAGKGLDPRLVEAFTMHATGVCAALSTPSTWSAFLSAEPGAPRVADAAQIDDVLGAMGDFVDLKSRFTRGHSRGVASLASAAAERAGLDAGATRTLARAALVHDVGCVAITAAVWDKPGPLSDAEWERVRAHSYVGERIVSRATSLAAVADVATLAHERLDGHGYHRRLSGVGCTTLGRLLAAADVFHALTEARAHRPAKTIDEASAVLSSLAREGRLCPDAVSAVLAGPGHASARKVVRPSRLTDREVDVLRLVARGLTNKEIAARLGISAKTAGNHLQHVFEKIGVTTRAGATMFAMSAGLLVSEP